MDIRLRAGGLRVLVLVAVAALLGGLAGTGPTDTVAAAQGQEAACARPRELAAPTAPWLHPVIFVHGWTSGPGSMRPLQEAVDAALAGRVATYQFDYAADAHRWAADEAVAGCLAVFIDAVAEASLRQGGHGRVLLVGHSMGGLAIRYASALNVQGRPVSDRIAGVVTLNTPHRGSYWGGTGYADVWEEVRRKLSRDQYPLPAAGADGAVCLASHQGGDSFPRGCGPPPPYLSTDTALLVIGGQVAVRRTLLRFHTYTIHLDGDSIVDTVSQHQYHGSGPTADGSFGTPVRLETLRCEVTSDALLTYTRRFVPAAVSLVATAATFALDDKAINAILEGRASPSQLLLMAVANLAADCSHLRMPRHEPAIDATLDALASWLDQLDSTTQAQPLDWRLVPIPDYGQGFDSRGHYPQVGGAAELERVNDRLRGLVLDDLRSHQQLFPPTPIPPEEFPGVYTVTPQQEFRTGTSTIVSTLIQASFAPPGGGVPGTYWLGLTVRVPSAELITIEDLFQDGPAAAVALETLVKEQLRAHPCVRLDLDRFPPAVDWRDIQLYRNFAMTPEGLVIGFAKYVVAPGACGGVSVVLAWSDLHEALNVETRQLIRHFNS